MTEPVCTCGKSDCLGPPTQERLKTKAVAAVAAANCDGHKCEVNIEDSTLISCKNCPWQLRVTDTNLPVVASFLSPVELFNYGVWLYEGILYRELAWDLIDTAIAIALSRLPPEELEELKSISKRGTETEVATDLEQYCFEDKPDKIVDFSVFHWHTWRVVSNLAMEEVR